MCRSPVTLKHPESSQSAYKVTVKTSDERGAGTDANVLLTLHGDTSSTPVPLKSGSATLFETNVTDVFQIKIPDVGDLKAITIEHDGTGEHAFRFIAHALRCVPVHACRCPLACLRPPHLVICLL